ncbi:hypothetical protein ACWEQ7_12725 [Streptomyces sp. NPDC004069]
MTLDRAARSGLLAGLAPAAACVQFAFAPELGAVGAAVILTTAVVCHTLGEIWQSAGGWEISYALSPEESRRTRCDRCGAARLWSGSRDCVLEPGAPQDRDRAGRRGPPFVTPAGPSGTSTCATIRGTV